MDNRTATPRRRFSIYRFAPYAALVLLLVYFKPLPDEQPLKSHLTFLFVAFGVSWAAFFGYAFFMTRRQRELARDLEALRKALEAKEVKPGQGNATP